MPKHQPKPPIPKPPVANALAAAAQQSLPSHGQLQQQVLTTAVQQYSGQIPPPDLLRGFDELIPGTAARLIQWAEDEQAHRRSMEAEAQAANIDAQRHQLEIADRQSRSVFRSDILGQIFGFLVCAGCIAGAVALALNGQAGVAVALTVIPTGAVIYAFRGSLFAKK
jgi:uncharacterized membrane protein